MTSTKHTGPITPENPFEAKSELLPQVEPYTITSDFKGCDLLKIRKQKNTKSNSIIGRNKDKELLVWNKLIKPIVESHDLKNPATGELFQYEFFPKDITERGVDFIIRETMILCDKLSLDTDTFNSPDPASYSINHQVMQPLRHKDEKTEVTGKNGEKIDLKCEFRKFLTRLFPDKLAPNKSPGLPEFLEMLNRETELAANPATGQPKRDKADISSRRVGADEAKQGLAPQETAPQNPQELHIPRQEGNNDNPLFDRKAWEEAVRLYDKIKEAGFKGPNVEKKLQDAAKKELADNKQGYQFIKQRHLSVKDLFALNGGQERRDFIGKLLQKIMGKSGKKHYIGAQRLYDFGKKNYQNRN